MKQYRNLHKPIPDWSEAIYVIVYVPAVFVHVMVMILI